MKKIVPLFILLFILYNIPLCSQDIIKEERSLRFFDAIEVTNDIEVYLSEGDSCSVLIEANDFVMKSVISEVMGQTLKLTLDDKYNKLNFKKASITAHIILPKLSAINVSRNSKVYGKTDFNCESLTLLAASHGEIKLPKQLTINDKLDIHTNSSGKVLMENKSISRSAKIIAASNSEIVLGLDIENNIECSASNKSKIVIKGKANDALISATSNSELRLKDFEVQRANVVVNTSAIIHVTVKEFLAATAAYKGIINYYGKPKSISKETTSGGKIR